MLRFHTPLIKPGGRFSRTRLSDKACEIAIHTRSPTNRCRDVRSSWCSLSFWCRYWSEKRFFPCPCSLNFADPNGLQVLQCRVSARRHFCHPSSFQGGGCENGRSTEDPASES